MRWPRSWREHTVSASGRLASTLPRLLTVSALATLAWVAADWSWRLMLPTPPLIPPADAPPQSVRVLAKRLAEAPLLGGEPAAPAVQSAGTALAGPPSGIELRGVYAPRKGRGFAILVAGGQAQAVLTGETLPQGYTLESVQPDHVVLVHGAARYRLDIVAPDGGQPAAPAGSTFRLQVQALGGGRYALSRSAFQEASKDPANYIAMGRFTLHPRGGAVLEASPPGGLAEQLGLKPGDIITHIDEQPLRNPEDASQLFQRIVARERVALRVLRDRASLDLVIDILP